MLEIHQVSKRYGATQALDRVTFAVASGEVVALLGRNGAGKSTLVSIVAGLRTADTGSIRIDGVDTASDRRRIRGLVGLAPQETGVYPTLTCRQNLRFFARWAGVGRRHVEARIDRLADGLELTDLLDRQARHLSGGEQRRLHTAIALVGDPPLVLLDEPTVGADVQTRGRLVDFVAHLASTGTTVVYSTHYLGEVESLGASVVVIDHGAVVARGSIGDIVAASKQGDDPSLEAAFIHLTAETNEPVHVG